MNKRVLSALIAIPLLPLFIFAGEVPLKIAVALIMGIAVYEYTMAYNHTEYKVAIEILASAYIINVILMFFYKPEDYMLMLIFAVVLFSMAIPVFKQSYNVVSSALTISGFIYIICFFTLVIGIREHIYGLRLIWLVFIISWMSDTGAYYAGRFFGKRKLCPKVSPKKTVAGSIGGVIGSTIGVLVWYYFNRTLNLPIYSIILLGSIGSVISQIGDLAASCIKRFAGIKDYGYIMPGHGGILDRFDSILYTTPVVYYYILLVVG